MDFVPVDFFSGTTLNGHSRDSVIPRLLTPHPHREWPEAGSAAFREEMQQVGAAGRHKLAHAIWTFRCLLERPRCSTDDDAADGHEGFPNCRIFIQYSKRLLDNHGLNLWCLSALVALVREDVRDQAIWTVAVVSQPVVADHHRHHLWELDYVEAPVMEIADVIAHAMHFSALALSRSPTSRWRSWGHPGGSTRGSGGPGDGDGPRGTSGSW